MIKVEVEDPLLGEVIEIEPDLLVLGERWAPSARTQELASALRVRLGPEGFFQDDNSQNIPVRANRKGVFLCGFCRQAQDLEEVLRDALAVAVELIAVHEDGEVSSGIDAAIVDEGKCVFCLTCFRSCPHQAIEIDQGGQAAKVIDVACEGCGVCVNKCPADAIEIPGYSDEDISRELAW